MCIRGSECDILLLHLQLTTTNVEGEASLSSWEGTVLSGLTKTHDFEQRHFENRCQLSSRYLLPAPFVPSLRKEEDVNCKGSGGNSLQAFLKIPLHASLSSG